MEHIQRLSLIFFSVNSAFSINGFFFFFLLFNFLAQNQFIIFFLLRQVGTDKHVGPIIFHVHYEKIDCCIY